MSPLPLSIPRAAGVQEFYEEPLGFLARARASLGDIFVLRDDGPIFSRAADCNGVIALFGVAHHQAVLSDIDLFGMPLSAAEHLSLPPNLVNLNHGLHSMHGEQHSEHQRALLRVLGERGIDDHPEAITAGIEAFLQRWRAGQIIELLSEMRQLALEVSVRVLFGDSYEGRAELASLLQSYFQQRREAAAPLTPPVDDTHDDLVALGHSLDRALRRYVKWCRRQPLAAANSLLMNLAKQNLDTGERLSEDSLVAHSNVLFVSSNEPIAVSLTWILLILSQLPDLRRQLRIELAEAAPGTAGKPARLRLLEAVINESLRLLTPNALMVRVTTRPALLCGVQLPARCELLLCPFLAHRDADRFPRPTDFLLSRWSGAKPSPFEYFPFGAGGHACVGRLIATHIIKAALTLLMPKYELVLAADQKIDWQIHIMLTPRNEPVMSVNSVGATALSGGKLLGPVADLINLNTQ